MGAVRGVSNNMTSVIERARTFVACPKISIFAIRLLRWFR
jgi:hypothetical protein